MSKMIFPERDFSSELTFSASRSSGAGGQNVNKVNTRVEVRLDINGSELLSAKEKEMVFARLGNRITSEGALILASQTERTQLANRRKAVERLNKLINAALVPVKKRKPTRPSRAAKEKRLTEKKVQSEKKARRRDTDTE